MMENKINLLHVVYGVMSGGVEQMLINYFSGDEFENYNLFIAYSNFPDDSCLNNLRKCGFIPIRLNHCTKNQFGYYRELKKIIKKYSINIVHANINIDNYLVLKAAYDCGVKTRIAHSHGLPSPSNLFAKKIFRNFKRTLCNKYSTSNLACSNKAGKYLFLDSNFKIMYNAIETDKFKYNPEIRKNLRKTLNIGNNIVIGYIARFYNGKNHQFLIEIFEQMHIRDKNIKILFIGAGPLKGKIEKDLNEKGLSNNFIILDSKSNIFDYYQVMDLFVFPSEEEGLGMVAIESQINGLYCIASTGVPKDTKISNNIEYIGFDKYIWQREIKNHLLIRNDNYKYECNCDNYNIFTQRNRLKKYYERELYNEK